MQEGPEIQVFRPCKYQLFKGRTSNQAASTHGKGLRTDSNQRMTHGTGTYWHAFALKRGGGYGVELGTGRGGVGAGRIGYDHLIGFARVWLWSVTRMPPDLEGRIPMIRDPRHSQ